MTKPLSEHAEPSLLNFSDYLRAPETPQCSLRAFVRNHDVEGERSWAVLPSRSLAENQASQRSAVGRREAGTAACSPNSPQALFDAKRFDGIDAGGTPGGKIARQSSDAEK